MTRGSDNREQVSALLNLSDGMLADFLRLQIICTINCSAADIDPALLRPVAWFAIVFLAGSTTPKPPAWPRVLAGNCHRPMINSLAEVFADRTTDEINRPRTGLRLEKYENQKTRHR